MTARISGRGQEDIEYIYALICFRQGLEKAEDFLENVGLAVRFLERTPEAGPHPQWATRHKTLRFWVISKTNFLIFYFADKNGVSIERVLDGRRDVKRIINRR